MVDEWNNLSKYVVKAQEIESFKWKLDEVLDRHLISRLAHSGVVLLNPSDSFSHAGILLRQKAEKTALEKRVIPHSHRARISIFQIRAVFS